MAHPKKTHVQLSDSDVQRLKRMIKDNKTNQTTANRCRILLALDENHLPMMTYIQCADASGISRAIIASVVNAYSDGGIDSALARKRSINSDNARRKVDGCIEAKVIKVACDPTPEGNSRWTIRLLEDEMRVVLNEPISHETIRRALKKRLRPHHSDYWCLLNKRNPEFIAAMEDILDVYELPYNLLRPVVCMDEKPYQLLGEVRESWAVRPGDNKKIDSEYVRNGTCSIFSFVEPLGGKHHTSVREHRTAIDWAEEIKYFVDEMYPDVENIVLVMDNLNTHKPASLYKKYSPEEARRIIKKLEIHYTPKHGSWLNTAEIELNVMTRQCLSRRIESIKYTAQ